MLDLASSLRQFAETRREGPWAGYEYVKGWAVCALAFDSGHVLAMRVFTEGNFVSYHAADDRYRPGRGMTGPISRLDYRCGWIVSPRASMATNCSIRR